MKKAPTIGLGLLLRRANKSFSGALSARLESLGISRTQFHHLRRLAEAEGVSSSELSARVEVTKATSTSILDALEARGLIWRERDAVDRRRVNVFLTDAGRAIQADLAAAAMAVNSAATRDFSAEEKLQLFDLLGRMVDALANEPGADTPDPQD